MEQQTNLYTIRKAAELPEFQAAGLTEPALRGLKFKSADRKNSRGVRIVGNGLSGAGAFVQFGRKVLVNPARLLAHVANGGRSGAAK